MRTSLDDLRTPHAEIAGAGLAGLALAAALARDGWSVRVHEAGDEIRATGGGLYVTQDGFETVRALGVYDDLMRGAFFPAFYETRVDGVRRSRDGNERHGYCTMLRGHLHATLHRAAIAAGVEIATRSRAVAAEPGGVLVLETGERRAADLVIAADGVGSGIAGSLGIASDRRRFDDMVARVLLDRTGLDGPDWSGSLDLWRYGARPLRVLYTPCSPAECYLVMMAPATDREAGSLPVDRTAWAAAFPELARLLDQPLDRARIDRYGTIRLARWSQGRVAVVGDAAHAMPSSIGKGASLGLWNAVSLARHLRGRRLRGRILRGEDGIEAGLAAWEAERRPIIEDAQATAERVALARTLTGGRSPAGYEVPLLEAAV